MRPIALLVVALALLASAAPSAAQPAALDHPAFVNALAPLPPQTPMPTPTAPPPLPPAPVALAPPNNPNTTNNTANPPYDVIVVGAGISGIAAALHLTNNTTSSSPPLRVVLLEARPDRAGGRLAASKEVPSIDAGAMWIHNARDPSNPLPALAKKHGLKMSPLQDYNSGAIFATDGSRAPLLPLATAAASWSRSFIPALRAVKMRNNTSEDESIWQAYEQWTQEGNKTADVLAAARLRLASNVETLLNADARNLSAARYGDSKVVPADDVVLEKGYSALVDAMLDSADPPLDVRYGAVVEAIEQQDEKNGDGDDGGLVTVRLCGGGGGNNSSLRARRVIVTVPLGVLKASIPDGGMSASSPGVSTAAWGSQTIPPNARGGIAFSPPLPEAKQRAIRDFGFGRLEKVILDYGREGDDVDGQASRNASDLTSLEVRRALTAGPTRRAPKSVFWDASRDFISIEPPVEQDAGNTTTKDYTPVPPFSVFLNYYKTLNRPVMVALNAGSAAERAASLGDPDAVAAAADAVLERLYKEDDNKTTRPPPTRYDVTDWAGDPFSRGSYSYFAVGNARDITAEIARPFGKVHFAGEHTSERAPATVHGALLSGEREARRVLEGL